MANNHYDIAIIGGGAVGSSLALALSRCHFKVALLDEKSPQDRAVPEKDNRIFALAVGTQHILQNLGVWELLHDKAFPIHSIHTSSQGSFGAARIHANDHDMKALGYMLASVDLQKALNTATQDETLTQLYPARFKTMSLSQPAHVVFEMKEKEYTISADTIIAADGAHSAVRKCLNLSSIQRDFKQKAIVAKIELANNHEYAAYERFVDDGAIAMLPFGAKQCALIWSLSNTGADTLLQLSDADFLAHLQNEFGYRLGKLKQISKRMSYPLVETISDQVTHQNQVIFVGNASQSLHPIAAQGFNLALRNIALLADMLTQIKRGEINKEYALEQFTRLQKKDQHNTRNFTNALVEFSSKEGLCRSKTIRSLALSGFEFCPPAKRHLMKGMMKGAHHLVRALNSEG